MSDEQRISLGSQSGHFGRLGNRGKGLFRPPGSERTEGIGTGVTPARAKGKHPVAVGNGQGEILLVWTEGTGWQKGGGVAWQLYDRAGNETSEKGRADGVPVWSLATAFAKSDGTFMVIY
jgi:hypothetical protein